MYQGEFNLVKRLWSQIEMNYSVNQKVIRILTDFVLKERRQSQKDQQDLVAKMTSEGHKMDPTEFEEKSNFVLSKTPAGKPFTSPFSVEIAYICRYNSVGRSFICCLERIALFLNANCEANETQRKWYVTQVKHCLDRTSGLTLPPTRVKPKRKLCAVHHYKRRVKYDKQGLYLK